MMAKCSTNILPVHVHLVSVSVETAPPPLRHLLLLCAALQLLTVCRCHHLPGCDQKTGTCNAIHYSMVVKHYILGLRKL